MRIPKLTVRFKSPQVQYSLGSIPKVEPSPPKWGPTHSDLPTNMHSQYPQENVNLKTHKHIHPGHHDQQNSKPGKSRRPISECSIKPQNLQVKYSPGSTPNWNRINLVTMTSKLHSNKVHKPFYRRYKITKPIRKIHSWGRRPGEILLSSAGQSRKSVISPSRARANTLVSPSFTEIPESTRQHNTTQHKLLVVQKNTNYQENPFLSGKTRRDSPVVSWAEQEILSLAQIEQEPPH